MGINTTREFSQQLSLLKEYGVTLTKSSFSSFLTGRNPWGKKHYCRNQQTKSTLLTVRDSALPDQFIFLSQRNSQTFKNTTAWKEVSGRLRKPKAFGEQLPRELENKGAECKWWEKRGKPHPVRDIYRWCRLSSWLKRSSRRRGRSVAPFSHRWTHVQLLGCQMLWF